jgi:phosphate transport system substrate-binding protein
LTSALVLAAAGMPAVSSAEARDQIRIVGSSTVYPFTTTVAEQFGKTSGMKTPVVESTGTGGGMKLFCAGVGVNQPDATNASRRMKKSEFDSCQKNGVKDIVEINIGFDGLTVAQSKQGRPIKLTLAQLLLAVAKEVPGPDGKLIPNPNKNWSDIDKSLPNVKIERRKRQRYRGEA